MAFPASGLAVQTMMDVFDVTQLAIDLDSDLSKAALFTNSVVSPDLTADLSYGVSPWNANEVSGTGYTAGGVVITGTTWTHSGTGVIEWDASAFSWTSATFSAARGMLVHADYLSPKRIVCAVNFGADFAVTAGTFTVTPASAGIFNWDVIP